jgi:acetyl esterase
MIYQHARLPQVILALLAGSLLSLQAVTHKDARGYVYKTVDGKDLQLDVFEPIGKSVNSRPVFLFIHGGGWTMGDKESGNQICRYFAARGLVAITANYRFMNTKATGIEGSKAYCLLDVKSAIRWVRSHAADLAIDPDRMILSGSSAGAHLAMMAALNTTINDATDDLKIPTTASALVLLNPAFIRISPGSKVDASVEPYPYISATVPPQIMFCGDKDGFRAGADMVLAACKAAGGRGEMWLAPGQVHGFTGQPAWMKSTCVKADGFLASLGLLQGSPEEPAAEATLVVAQP